MDNAIDYKARLIKYLELQNIDNADDLWSHTKYFFMKNFESIKMGGSYLSSSSLIHINLFDDNKDIIDFQVSIGEIHFHK